MALEFSTAGVKVLYAVESTAGTRPTTGYTQIPGIKSTPDFNPAPNSIQVTDLSDTEYHRYIPALKDVGGASAFTANLTSGFKSAWEALVTASETARESNKATWFEIRVPDSTVGSFYFAGIPTPLGVSAFEVDSVAEIDAYVTPNQITGWSTPSTTSGGVGG